MIIMMNTIELVLYDKTNDSHWTKVASALEGLNNDKHHRACSVSQYDKTNDSHPLCGAVSR